MLSSLFSGGGSSDFGLYTQDGEIVYTNHTKNDSWEVSSRLLNGNNVRDSYLWDYASTISAYTAITENGKRIFYPDYIEDFYSGVTLYYRDLTNSNKDAVKLDSDITKYAINSEGSKLLYLKNSGSVLYLHDLEDKDKLASDVSTFYTNHDLSKIIYRTTDNSVYSWTAKEGSTKIATEIYSLNHVASDLSFIAYFKEDSLYTQATDGSEREKIASDISNVISIYDSGEIYYAKSDVLEKGLLQYVTDDLASSDANIVEPSTPNYPTSPDYPRSWNFDEELEYELALVKYELDYEEYIQVYDNLKQEYVEATALYKEKVARDRMRSDLDSSAITTTEYTLYYFDGKESTSVTNIMVNPYDIAVSSETAVLLINVFEKSELPSIYLSDVTSIYDVSNLVSEALFSSAQIHVVVGDSTTMIEQNDATEIIISNTGDAIYFLDDISSNYYGDLYQILINKGSVESPKMYDDDVSSRAPLFFSPSGEILYFKDVDTSQNKGEMYINKQAIDYDVRMYDIFDLNGDLIYYTDWNSSKSYGTLKIWSNGKSTKISDDISSYDITLNGDIRYLSDYSSTYYNGTAYLYNGSKSEKLSDDVTSLISVTPAGKDGGNYYGW